MSTNHTMVLGKSATGEWSAMFGTFSRDEAPDLADSIATLFDQCKMERLELTCWDPSVKEIVDHLMGQGFVFSEHKDEDGTVVKRLVYRKRDKEQ